MFRAVGKLSKVIVEFGLFLVGFSFFVEMKMPPKDSQKKESQKAEQVEPDFVKGITLQPPIVDFSNAWLAYSRNTGDLPQWRN